MAWNGWNGIGLLCSAEPDRVSRGSNWLGLGGYHKALADGTIKQGVGWEGRGKSRLVGATLSTQLLPWSQTDYIDRRPVMRQRKREFALKIYRTYRTTERREGARNSHYIVSVPRS